MGDRPMLALSEAAKSKLDVVVVPTTLLGYIQLINWPETAAFLAAVYTGLRIGEMLIKWWRRRK
jgi:hypothetical protein